MGPQIKASPPASLAIFPCDGKSLAIAIPFVICEGKLGFGWRRGGGAEPDPLHVGPPRKRRHVSLSAVVCCACVTSMLCAVLSVSVLRNVMNIVNTPAKYRDQRRGSRKLNGLRSVSASWGRLGERGPRPLGALLP